MTTDEFIERARNPDSWFYMADGLLRDHAILAQRSDELLHAVLSEEYSSEEKKNLLSRGAASTNNSASYLLAMSLENALKGHLLLEQPEEFQITLKRDAQGNSEGSSSEGKEEKSSATTSPIFARKQVCSIRPKILS